MSRTDERAPSIAPEPANTRAAGPAPAERAGAPAEANSAHEVARFVASVSLSLGALMLSLFGIVERLVSFEKLGQAGEFALLSLLPGIATLSFLACARAISWMISYMTFTHWHAVIPPARWEEMRARIEAGTQFQFRITMMAGAYLLFTLVISALAATSAGLTFGLSAPELGIRPLPFALAGSFATAALVLHEMLTRDRPLKSALTAAFAALLIAVMLMDVVL